MIYFKRFLWLAAWGVWVWLGFGLYRELPRELGPVVCRLPMNGLEDWIAFLHNRPSILTLDDDPDDRLQTIRLRNARTGEIEQEIKSEGVGIPRAFGFFNSFRHGFHGRFEGPRVGANTTWPIFVLELSTGVWRRFDDVGTDPRSHPTEPWAMFSRSDGDANDDAVIVLELKTGRRVFDSRDYLPKERIRLARTWRAFFIGDEAVGIPFAKEPRKDAVALEIWSMTTGSMLRRIDGIDGCERATASRDGKIAWYGRKSPFVTEVFDSATGERLLAVPPERDRIATPIVIETVRPAFSEDGKRILSTPAGGLFEIATGERVWDAADHESIWIVRPPDRFEVHENWKFSLFGKPIEFSTFAIRRLHDGAFISRSIHSTLSEFRSNADETLFLESETTVRELPLRVNWFYLSLAQAILAVPIVLPWAVLCYRHRRAARRQPAVAKV
jgi:hypothetical protein